MTRSFGRMVGDMIRKPPILLPLVGVAHVLWLLRTLWDSRNIDGLSIEWLQVLWMVGYTFFWLAACNLKRWAVYGYLVLTITNTVIYITAGSITARDNYTSNLFIIDIIFTFFLIIYYKRFQ